MERHMKTASRMSGALCAFIAGMITAGSLLATVVGSTGSLTTI